MCAGSFAKLRDKKVIVYMGYFGGNIVIDNDKYDVEKNKGNVTKEEMKNLLCKYTKKELSQLIVDLIENSDE